MDSWISGGNAPCRPKPCATNQQSLAMPKAATMSSARISSSWYRCRQQKGIHQSALFVHRLRKPVVFFRPKQRINLSSFQSRVTNLTHVNRESVFHCHGSLTDARSQFTDLNCNTTGMFFKRQMIIILRRKGPTLIQNRIPPGLPKRHLVKVPA